MQRRTNEEVQEELAAALYRVGALLAEQSLPTMEEDAANNFRDDNGDANNPPLAHHLAGVAGSWLDNLEENNFEVLRDECRLIVRGAVKWCVANVPGVVEGK